MPETDNQTPAWVTHADADFKGFLKGSPEEDWRREDATALAQMLSHLLKTPITPDAIHGSGQRYDSQGLTFRLEHDSLGEEDPQLAIDTKCPYCDFEEMVSIETLKDVGQVRAGLVRRHPCPQPKTEEQQLTEALREFIRANV